MVSRRSACECAERRLRTFRPRFTKNASMTLKEQSQLSLITAVIKEGLPLVHRHVDDDLHPSFFNYADLVKEIAQILGLH